MLVVAGYPCPLGPSRCRTPAGNRALATPKTVPPHFAPHEADASGAPMSSAPLGPLGLGSCRLRAKTQPLGISAQEQKELSWILLLNGFGGV